MAYTNSKMVVYTKISPHRNSPRNQPISKITIHYMAGDLSIETCGNVFQTRQASSNYGIGSDGRVGMYAPESDRTWCSSSPWNDNRAITIEVANDRADGHVTDKAYKTLIELCVDICKRNGMTELVYTGDQYGSLTRHNMFDNTSCPGAYLQAKFPDIAKEVTKRLKTKPAEPEKEEEMTQEKFNEMLSKALNIDGTGKESSKYAAEATEFAKEKGLFVGDADGDFGWKKPITRQDMAIVAKKLFDLLK